MPRAEIMIDLERAQRAIDAAQREVDLYEPEVATDEFQMLITEAQRLLLAVDGLLSERDQATERARIAAAAYDGQQSSQRELEALYQAATERAERAENRQRDMVRTLVHTYMRLFPTYEFVSYEQALVVIEREWASLFGDALAMADALSGFFKARESTEPHDTPEYIDPMQEAWRAYLSHVKGGML